ncbi:transglycosylase domain-containing protein, partial [bacterium]|nr:transglycosylase domain-containing protein [bacterium]
MVNNASKSSFVRKIVIFLLTIFGVFAIGFYFFAKTLPRLPKKLDEIMLSPPTEIYDSKNKLITTLGGRKSVKIGSISPHFQNAIVAIEDARFFSHHGIDKLGILRAILKNITKNKSEGASTITQQLARNLFFTFEKRYDRKIAEAFVSFQIEQQFSKMEILENYCNLIYLGSGAYGIEYASEIYFAKSAKDLNLAEAALIAGIPKWPAKYSPYVNFEEAKKRQTVVLTRMLEEKMITQAEFDEAKNFPLKLGRLNKTAEIASYYVDFVKQETIEILSKDYEIPVSSAEQVLYYGGLKIYTTLETEMQVKAQLSIQKQITLLDEKLKFPGYTEATQQEKKQYLQAALVAIEPQTGKILAMVGGRDYYTSPFNRTVTA